MKPRTEAALLLTGFIALVVWLDRRDQRRRNGDRTSNDAELFAHVPSHSGYLADEEHRAAEREQWRRANKIARWLNGITLSAVVLSVIALIFAVGGYFSLKSQVAEAHRQADIASDTERRQLRAYVSVRAEPTLEVSADEKANAGLTITDTGQTPAYHVKWAHEFLTDTDYEFHGMDRPCEQMWFMNVEEGNLGILGREVTKPVGGSIQTRRLPLSATNNKGSAVYLIGKVCYEDVFREVHWTSFCIVWKGVGGRRGNAEYCDKGGNDADRGDQPVRP